MTHEIGVFLGADLWTSAADSDELLTMGHTAFNNGAIVGPYLSSDVEEEVDHQVNRANGDVEINLSGGMLGVCLRQAMVVFVHEKKLPVKISLSQCRINQQDSGNNPGIDVLQRRRETLTESVPSEILKSPLLHIQS